MQSGAVGCGIFIELGDGPCTVDNNVCAFTPCGDGIYLHDSSGVTIAHNLCMANAHFGIYTRVVTDRKCFDASGRHVLCECSRLRLLNNLVADNYRGHVCVPAASERVKQNEIDYNLYLNGFQWHWEGMAYHQFCINQSNGPSTQPDAIVNNKNVSPTPLVSFDVWQKQCGFDINGIISEIARGEVENGAVEKGGAFLSSREARLDVRDARVIRLLSCHRLANVMNDLCGKPIPESNAVPGPLQTTAEEPTSWKLWPLK